MDQDVVDTQYRHAGVERLPLPAAVQRDEKTKLGTGVQQILVLRIFANDVNRAPLRQVADNRRPRRAVVTRDEQDGFEISVAAADAEPLARRLLEQPEVAPIGLGARNS